MSRRAALVGRGIVLVLILMGGSDEAVGQMPTSIVVRGSQGEEEISIVYRRGFPAVSERALEMLGWTIQPETDRIEASLSEFVESSLESTSLRIHLENPFVLVGGEVGHLVSHAYAEDGDRYIPLQLLVDLLPRELPELFEYDAGSATLQLRTAARSPDTQSAAETEPPARAQSSQNQSTRTQSSSVGFGPRRAMRPPTNDPDSDRRVVVIDPGHGGRDPGTAGPTGLREKEFALGLAIELAEELRKDPRLEVVLTRETDELVEVWERGEIATGAKGSLPAIFLSLHANAVPGQPEIRGFETYFLAEARTDHERRVAALENTPVQLGGESETLVTPDSDLSTIFNELRNFDHQHWSALLAQLVQDEVGSVHPGPNRGVKQGPFAVLTNTLMPAVLLEVGFITNAEEARLLTDDDFREDLSKSLARAVRRFFLRYPPGVE